MKRIEFKKAGKWAEVNTLLPQFEVKAGEQHPVSDELAKIIVDAGAGKIVEPTKAEIQAQEDEKKRLADEAEANAQEDADLATALASAKESLGKLTDDLKVVSTQRDELEAANTAAAEKIAELEKAAEATGVTIEDLQKQLEATKDKKTPATKDKKTPATKDKKAAESK